MTARGAGPPAVIGAAISLPDTLRRELAPRPGRLADTLRLLALILISVVISETFGIPEVAISAYIIVFITRDEAFSSMSLGIAVIIIATFGIGATIVTLTIARQTWCDKPRPAPSTALQTCSWQGKALSPPRA